MRVGEAGVSDSEASERDFLFSWIAVRGGPEEGVRFERCEFVCGIEIFPLWGPMILYVRVDVMKEIEAGREGGRGECVKWCGKFG